MRNYRKDFPILGKSVGSNELIYFDNAASTQKPDIVINAISEYYQNYNSNIHRGAHHLANIVPWLALQEKIGFEIRYIPIKRTGNQVSLDSKKSESLFDKNTKLLSIAHVSNAIGTIHDISFFISTAKQHNTLIHLDLAQSIQHFECDIKSLDIDFASFSSHKIYGPMGVGVFYGKKGLLESCPPYQKGGEMIKEVFFDKVEYNTTPFRFEAGTPNVAGVIGLGKAISYINEIGLRTIESVEREVYSYFIQKISEVEQVILYTPLSDSCSAVSFNIKGIHSYDIGQILDSKGIATRTGHHCCQPLMKKLEIEGTCRASISFYNTMKEVDIFIQTLKKAIQILS